MEFDMHNKVKVKLTSYGKKCLNLEKGKKVLATINGYGSESLKKSAMDYIEKTYVADEEGYFIGTMWEIMDLFGQYLKNLHDKTPFESEIEIFTQEEDLKR